MSDLAAARPKAGRPGWLFIDAVRMGSGVIDGAYRFQRRAVLVVSSLNDAEYPDRSGRGPQWHVSISRMGKRPTATDVAHALRDFGMVGAEEDNHHPGAARHFWRPVDPTKRVDCECKADEATIVEPDGYTWTNPIEGPCRGCEHAAQFGRVCPLHPAPGASA